MSTILSYLSPIHCNPQQADVWRTRLDCHQTRSGGCRGLRAAAGIAALAAMRCLLQRRWREIGGAMKSRIKRAADIERLIAPLATVIAQTQLKFTAEHHLPLFQHNALVAELPQDVIAVRCQH